MAENSSSIVQTQMLIRKPIQNVFEAIVDPRITTKFWFTKSTGKLEKGKEITWEWEMYNAKANVKVLDLKTNEVIAIEWGKPVSAVEFRFSKHTEDSCLVKIKCYGFSETGDQLKEVLKDNMGGFTSMLAGMKAYLEHGIQLNLVADMFPR